jgi:hypothetical protein
MLYVWVIVLFNVFHVEQATLDKEYMTKNDCRVAIVKMGYARISPLGVHGECQMVVVPQRLVPPAKVAPK